MNRYKGFLAAGTFVGLVIITLLALGFGSLKAVADSGTAVPQEEIQLPVPQTTNLTNDEAMQAWQQYSAELEETVRTMQDRENTYQSQIDMANQTILQLQDQLNIVNSGASSGEAYTDDDGNEVREEHEEHEEYEQHEDSDD